MSSVTAAAAPAAQPRPRRRALAWLAFLGPFFFASYGFANWLASRHEDVGAIVFDWEQRIPFLPWTIVPYWSIDLLYGVSVFVCATRAELDVHAKRLLLAQLVSVACFILFPLHFTFPRPEIDGVFGALFALLMGFDKPFNQAPSLHIALLVILWTLYQRHAAPGWRWLVHGWFALIGVSVLTTYQHHFIDVPTGLWVGWLCLWLLPPGQPSLLSRAVLARDRARLGIAARYLAGAVAVAAFSLWLGGAWLWLLWVGASLLLVAGIYALLDETAFQKSDGGLISAAACWLLAPYLAGAWLNSRLWTRSSAIADTVVPGVLIGRLPSPGEREAHGIRAIVDVAAELPCAAQGVRYVSVPQLDLVGPSHRQLERAAHAIDSAVSNGPVLVCCALGFSRSAAAVAAWLLWSGRAASAAEAVAQVRRARPAAVLKGFHLEILERFAEACRPAEKGA